MTPISTSSAMVSNNGTPAVQPLPLLESFTLGFVGFGEVNTPRDLIERKCRAARDQLAALGPMLVETTPVSDDPAGEDVRRAVRDLSVRPIDALVLCVAGWIPSHAVIHVADEFRHLPILLWGLAGSYEGGRLVTTADQAGTTALRKTMSDLGYRVTFVFDFPGKPSRVNRIRDFCAAASATRSLRRSKVGMMGYRDMRLYATLHDPIALKRALGVEVETFEMLEMVQRMETVASSEVEHIVTKVSHDWQFDAPADPQVLQKSARCYCALRAIIRESRYDAISLIDVDGMKKLMQLPPAMIFMLIADDLGIPTIPENDSLGSVTQLIVRELTAQAAPYFEFYEFMEDRLLVGVPDYVPAEVVQGRVSVRPTRFGSFSEALLNVSKIRTGRVTLVRLISHENGYAMHIVTGSAVEPRPWEEAGWQPPAPQLPGLEIILDTSVDAFAEEVAAQHYILAYGDITESLRAFCRMNQIAVR